jgi:hypothetical protein
MGVKTQKKQNTIVTSFAFLSIILISDMVASPPSLFDQKADGPKSKSKKFTKGGNDANGDYGGNGGHGNTGISGEDSSGGGSCLIGP